MILRPEIEDVTGLVVEGSRLTRPAYLELIAQERSGGIGRRRLLPGYRAAGMPAAMEAAL